MKKQFYKIYLSKKGSFQIIHHINAPFKTMHHSNTKTPLLHAIDLPACDVFSHSSSKENLTPTCHHVHILFGPWIPLALIGW